MTNRETMELALKVLRDGANWCRLYYGSKGVGDAIRALEIALVAEQPKPEALRLADELEAFARFSGGGGMDVKAAAELRRLHAEVIGGREAVRFAAASVASENSKLRFENERLREEKKVLLEALNMRSPTWKGV